MCRDFACEVFRFFSTTNLSSSTVPTDALANKLFGAPEPSSIARSLPTTVPDSPNYRSARTPRTPRTPHRKDPTMTPRFYPVVKESRPVDAKVRCWNCVLVAKPVGFSMKSSATKRVDFSPRPFRRLGRGRPGTAPTRPWSSTSVGWWTPESIGPVPPPSGETLCSLLHALQSALIIPEHKRKSIEDIHIVYCPLSKMITRLKVYWRWTYFSRSPPNPPPFSLSALMQAHRRAPPPWVTSAALPSPSPSSSTHRTSCSRRTASRNTFTTSTAGVA